MQTAETISGVVESEDKITPVKGRYSGIHLMLETDKETIAVHLVPEWYPEWYNGRQDTKLEKGDKIEVKGPLTHLQRIGLPVRSWV